MIRHQPEGRGHAYRPEADQRVPVRPIDGSPMELRATTPAGVSGVSLEIEVDGERRRVVSAALFEPVDEVRTAGLAADDSHLAAAAAGASSGGGAALAGGRRAWRVVLEAPSAGTRMRYRFTAEDGSATRWHAVVIAGWQADGGRLLGWQGEVAVFAGFSLLLVLLSWKWVMANRSLKSDQPHLNQRHGAYVGRVLVLDQAIVHGSGKVRIEDALWDVDGPDLPKGAMVKIVGVKGLRLVGKAAG